MLVLGFLYSKSTPVVKKKKKSEKKPACQTTAFFINTNKHKYPKIVHSKYPVHGLTQKILFPHQYKTFLSVYDKNTSKWSSNAQI